MSEPINRKVLDLSHHNSITSCDTIVGAGIVGIIHKATQGTGFVDDQYLSRARDALNRGLMWGAYHFGDNTNPQAQVDNFLRVVGIDNETLYALDWEDNPGSGGTMSYNTAVEFINLLEKKIGVGRTVIYSGHVAKEQVDADDDFFGSRRPWLA